MAETRTIRAIDSAHPGRRFGQWLALAGTGVAVAVVVALVVSWPNNGDQTLSIAGTAPAAKADVRVRGCGPIFGGGVPHRVTSSGRPAPPAGCSEAHSVLLAALNGGDTRVAGWHCARGPNARTLEVCTSAGGRRVAARN